MGDYRTKAESLAHTTRKDVHTRGHKYFYNFESRFSLPSLNTVQTVQTDHNVTGLNESSYRVQDGAQDDLVGAGLQNNLHISLEQSGLCEKLCFCGEGLGGLVTVRFPFK